MPYDWEETPPHLGQTVAEIVRVSEQAGYDSIWTIDHLFAPYPAEEWPAPEAYTMLSFVAAHSHRAKLGVMVSAVTFRHPALLVKQVTTLDVLTDGRAMLGIGAGWYDREHVGLGIPFPRFAERAERLEETLQIAHRMWGDDDQPFSGKHYQMERPLNVPQAVQRPHPPIMVGGSGERKTLPLVVKYADACNFFMCGPATVKEKLEALGELCVKFGRDFDSIERTVAIPMDVGENGSDANEVLDQLGEYRELGVQTVISWLTGVSCVKPLDIVGERILPVVSAWA
jgi:F420-dependent oxidoreductase-like protein